MSVYLRVAKTTDAEFFNEIRNDKKNAESLNWTKWSPENLNETIEYIERKKDNLLIVIDSDDNRVGYVQIVPFSIFGSNYIDLDEVGIFIVPKFQGNGYGKSSLLALSDYFSTKLGFIARVDETNIPSCKLFYSAGYELNGQIPVVRKDNGENRLINMFVKKNDSNYSRKLGS